MVGACNLLGVDVMTGHWEFTYLDEEVISNVKDFKGDFVCQNVFVKDDASFDYNFADFEGYNEETQRAFKPYTIKEMDDGIRVAVIGQAFPYTPIANPGRFIPDWTFGIRDSEMQATVDQVRATEKPDVVVVISHNGMDVDLKMASVVSGIDVIFGGHTHDGVPHPSVVKNKGGKTPIFPAAKGGSLELVKLLVDKGSKIPTTGLTPLHAAAGGHFLSPQNIEKRRTALVKFFLDRAVDVNAKCNTPAGAETTVLHAAAISARKAVVELLIEKGAQVNTKGKGGKTPLFSAALAGNKGAAEALITSGANVNAKDNRQCTALHYAVQLNNFVSYATREDRIEFVELLLAHGADVNALDARQYTPLHLAIIGGWPSSPERETIVQVLLVKGANPNTKDRSGKTPLKLAYGNPEIVTLLLKYGAKQ